ncbi:MAG: ABC transporter permease [Blastocatellia bacterium]|nr:ABC transporter permease [Blastocatellia bacterium]
MQTFLLDLRYGARMLLKKPGFTLIAIITLALGIGANTAIFSVINGVLLRPLPFAEPERLVALWETRNDVSGDTVSYPDFADWRAQNQVFERIAVYHNSTLTLTGEAQPAILRTVMASAELFPLLGAKPLIGRTFLTEEDKPGNRVALFSHNAWQKYFNADPNIAGRQVTLNGRSWTIVGVMAPGFNFPVQAEQADLWVTPAMEGEKTADDDAPLTEQRGVRFLRAIARLKPGVTLSRAQADMDAIMGRLSAQYGDDVGGYRAVVKPFLGQVVGDDIRRALLVLFGAVGLVLLIACANIANLLLARAVTREKEIAVRSALGANRWRIIRQLLTESALLAFVGGAAGLLLAVWGTDLLKWLSPKDLPRVEEIRLDWRVLGFTLLVSLLTGLIFGLAPALRAAKIDLNETLKEGGRSGSESIRRNRFRSALIISEIALALSLLIGAGLLVNSFLRLQRVDPGFDPHKVLTLRVDLPDYKYRKAQEISGFNLQLIERVEHLPGVRAAGMVFPLPLSGSDAVTRFEIEGRPVERVKRPPTDLRFATDGYFRTMGIPIISGRDFTKRDILQSPNVVIINEALAHRHFPNENPIGKRIRPGLSIDENAPPMREIIGVVGDVQSGSLSAEDPPAVYLPHSQFPFISVTMTIRAETDPLNLVGAVRNEVSALDKDLAIDDVKTLDQYLTDSVAQPKFNTLLLTIFACVAMILTAVGLYGVMAYSVAQRTHEIGIRMALGAQSGDVLKLVVRQGIHLALIGVACGLAGAFALTRLMEGLLFGVSATDPLTFAGVAVLFIAVAMLACYIPARRAARVDPMEALRYE